MRPRVHPRATPVCVSLSHQSELTLSRERSAAGASQATQLAFVPLSADPVCAARAPFGGEPLSCLRSCRSAPPRLRTRLPVDSFIWLPAVRGAGAVPPGGGSGAPPPSVRRHTELLYHREAWQGCKERGGVVGAERKLCVCFSYPAFSPPPPHGKLSAYDLSSDETTR